MPLNSAAYPYGFARMLLWFYDSSGYCTGTSTTLANGSGSGAYLMSDVKVANLNFAPIAELQIQGGDRIKATPAFGNPRLAGFDVNISSLDPALSDYINQSTRNTTNSLSMKVGYNPNRAQPVNMGICLQQRQDHVDGVTRWNNLMIPKAQVLFRRGVYGFRAESDATLHVAPITSTGSYNGMTYDSTANSGLNFGWEENRGDYYEFWSANPIHIYAFRADAIATTFTTTYHPLSSVITLNATANEMCKNGVPTALTSFATATALATLTAAGTAADMHVLTYETNFV